MLRARPVYEQSVVHACGVVVHTRSVTARTDTPGVQCRRVLEATDVTSMRLGMPSLVVSSAVEGDSRQAYVVTCGRLGGRGRGGKASRSGRPC